jgi:hypothetical protein
MTSFAQTSNTKYKETEVRERKKNREKVKKNVRACACNRIQICRYKATIVVAVAVV